MNWDEIAGEYGKVASFVFKEQRSLIEKTARELADIIKRGQKILICGNGGSAADAQHFSGELINKFLRERHPYAGIALSTDTSVLTAIGNDFGYEWVFEKQVKALGQAGDAFIGISTSGRAANVCKAAEAAKAKKMLTIGFTGGDGGQLGKIVERVVSISCTKSTPRIQEGHQLVIHLMCQMIEDAIEG